jgi:hypothetical protein
MLAIMKEMFFVGLGTVVIGLIIGYSIFGIAK